MTRCIGINKFKKEDHETSKAYCSGTSWMRSNTVLLRGQKRKNKNEKKKRNKKKKRKKSKNDATKPRAILPKVGFSRPDGCQPHSGKKSERTPPSLSAGEQRGSEGETRSISAYRHWPGHATTPIEIKPLRVRYSDNISHVPPT